MSSSSSESTTILIDSLMGDLDQLAIWNQPISQSAGHRFTFTLCWPSGEVIRSFQVDHDMCVERFIQDMDDGLMPELPLLVTWQQGYRLLLNDVELREGQKFSDYDLPPDAVLTVVRTTRSSLVETPTPTWVARDD